jgi:uridine monophosphate synthetase
MNFLDKLMAAVQRSQSLLFLGLDPNPEMMPLTTARQTDTDLQALRDWLEQVIAASADHVCAYKPTLGFYLALGSAGLELLQQVLRQIPPEIPIILDAKHSDLNTSTILARTVFQTWGVDAITLNPLAGQDLVAPFLVYPDKAAFVLCHTSNPTAALLQDFPDPANPWYLQVARQAQGWGSPEQLGLEVGSATPEILAQIRSLDPERWILARSLWAEGVDLEAMVTAGLNTAGEGLLIPVPQDHLSLADPDQAIADLRHQIHQLREQAQLSASTCSLWMPDVCFLNPDPQAELILQLYDMGCILFGDYVQASGKIFPYYIDLRTIISKPQIFHQIVTAYAEILQQLQFDRIAGIPYGSLPTATGLALRLNRPMIYPRKEVKAHGTRRLIEGAFQPGETVVVVDDILITGKSVLEGAAKLQSAGLEVHDIVVFIDHEQGVADRLAQQGYRSHAVLGISQITETLYECGRLTESQYHALESSHTGSG